MADDLTDMSAKLPHRLSIANADNRNRLPALVLALRASPASTLAADSRWTPMIYWLWALNGGGGGEQPGAFFRRSECPKQVRRPAVGRRPVGRS